jgi:hypothetical protein
MLKRYSQSPERDAHKKERLSENDFIWLMMQSFFIPELRTRETIQAS